MSRPKKESMRVQAMLDDELMAKVNRIKNTNNLESYPQTVRLIIKWFDEKQFNDRNKHLQQEE